MLELRQPRASPRRLAWLVHAAGEVALEPRQTLEQAERELGLAGWVDADTGELAEDTLTRLEDH